MDRLKYPEYSRLQTRSKTFASWSRKEQAKKMAEAGFFSTNVQDSVRCFQCGVGLREWDPGDDPWVEHARWMPNCAFILSNTSQEFINQVKAAVNRDKAQNGVENSRLPENDIESDCPPVRANKDTITMEYPESTYEKNPLLTDAAQSVLEFGYLPKVIKEAIGNIIQQVGGWKNLTGSLILEELFRLEDEGRSLQNGKHLDVQKDVLSTDEMERENESMREARTCKICCEKMVAIVFLPCGHLVCCAQCAPALKKCPMCRQPIKGSTRVTFGT